MMMMNLTKPQADATAVLVHALRPGWDTRGIMTALRDATPRAPAAVVVVAAVQAAADDRNRTPAVIPLPGPHWPPTSGPGPTPSPDPPCPICRRDHNPDDPDRHVYRADPATTARGAAAARAALRARKDTPWTHDATPAPPSPTRPQTPR